MSSEAFSSETPRGPGRDDEPGPDEEFDDGRAPAEVLGEIWPLLDELPQAVASSRLTATTVELAAVSVGRDAARVAPGDPATRRRPAWLGPAAAVAAALAAGLVAGRFTAPTDGRVFEQRAIVRPLELLTEAGSEAFLQALAARRAEQPFRGLPRPAGEIARKTAEAFTAELDDLRILVAADRSGGDARAWLDALPLDERAEFEKSAESYRHLSRTQRDLLAGVAAALVDPERPELREAAIAWHGWLSGVRPADRPEIIGYGTDNRLAWVDWYASRLDPRSRPGPAGQATDRLPWDWERRRPPGGFRPGGPPPFRPEAGPSPGETPAPPR